MYNIDFNEFKFSHKIDEQPEMLSGFLYHNHLNFEILLFIEGEVEYIIENRKYILKPFDVLFIKPGEHHFLKFLSKKRYERMVIRFPDYFIPKIIETSLKNKPALYNIKDSRLFEHFHRFDDYAACFSGEKLNILFMSSLNQLLISLNEFSANIEQPTVMDETIEQILFYINDHISSPISINEICSAYYISKTKLYRMFYENMNLPIAQYIKNKKILLAYNLIKNGKKPTQVAEDLGFSEYSTFYRTYLRIVGSPPSTKEST